MFEDLFDVDEPDINQQVPVIDEEDFEEEHECECAEGECAGQCSGGCGH